MRDFVNRFTAFNDYRHCVLARYKEKTYHLPTILHVGGRLSGFRYYDMDQAMSAALALPL